MAAMITLGIDGGGSTLRAAAVDHSTGAPVVLYEARRETANPSVIGRDAAAERICDAVAEVCARVDAPPAAVGIGVAGASPRYADAWLRAVCARCAPGIPAALASDVEIALVGAHGARRGAIVMSGTGSVALAIDADGAAHQAGGWGYLLGDEGSAYWIGVQGLRQIMLRAERPADDVDGVGSSLLDGLHLPEPHAALSWVYGGGAPDVKAIAAIAPLVLSMADEGMRPAVAIVERAAAALAALARRACELAGAPGLPIAFGGGLLTAMRASNPLPGLLARALGMDAPPIPRFSPVIGAGLHALSAIAL
jgi:N-acetylglucosamine kinase-like BadF-type ATPase